MTVLSDILFGNSYRIDYDNIHPDILPDIYMTYILTLLSKVLKFYLTSLTCIPTFSLAFYLTFILTLHLADIHTYIYIYSDMPSDILQHFSPCICFNSLPGIAFWRGSHTELRPRDNARARRSPMNAGAHRRRRK